MNEINLNKEAWGQLSKDHYNTFLNQYRNNKFQMNSYIQQELGAVKGMKIIHLQCNTGADTIKLAQMGASRVIGVDLVPDNIFYAKQLAKAKEPDEDDTIGGYASEVKEGAKNYFWMHTVSDIINALTRAGLHIEFFNEFPVNYYNTGDMSPIEGKGLYEYAHNKDKYPMSFSLKASVYKSSY